ncbi:tol-pal system protein YbgF [Pseudodesulfovibrio thermohalotolerans]|uniref:tol-pal system protein YbgF n=1 Tax=Pseudodesulfovibrio thermohalotolerans TaxID=2880651 RepID=UPI0024430A86|nr:tol-pal system protein YbgF [Pseudodesulfovibrio thermohalotolerans]WFS64034.1 tol-pal system protein YbgF [Pseudodesulfovibrio thermohalotolerans]
MKCLKLLLVALTCLPLVACAATGKNAGTEAASTEWRIQSLEESFLNFREQQRKMADEDALERRKLEERIAAAEVELATLRTGQAGSVAASAEDTSGDAPWAEDLKPDENGWVEGVKPVEEGTSAVKSDAEQPWAKVPGPAQTSPESETKASVPAKAASKAASKPTPKPAPASDPKTLYERGYARYNAGDYAGARTVFDDFVARYPNDKLAANALYWKGETYYSERNYPQAILAFKEVTGKFPKHDKAAAALLKIGMSYDRVGDPDNAIFYLRALVEDFPKSSAAGLGRKELARLGG